MLATSCTSEAQRGPEESHSPSFPTPQLGTQLLASDADVVFLGEQKEAYAGWSVDLAGDLNEDGHADVLIGAPFWGGQVYISEGPFESEELLSESVHLESSGGVLALRLPMLATSTATVIETWWSLGRRSAPMWAVLS